MLLFKASVHVRGYTYNQKGANEALKFLRKEFTENFAGCWEITARETFTRMNGEMNLNKEVIITVLLKFNEWSKFVKLCKKSKTYTLQQNIILTGLFGITRIV